MKSVPSRSHRLTSIDRVRGLVMVVMALDHVRDMLTAPQPALLDFADAPPALFLTRWVTHVCAPTFVLLAGTSAYLFGRRVTKSELASFLVTRGLWLVFAELTILALAWNFNLGPRFVPALQVLWVVGVAMIVLAGMVWLPWPAIALPAAAMIVGHNLLDALQPVEAEISLAWRLLHVQGPLVVAGQAIGYVVYPLVPWIAVLALGYAIGPLFERVEPERRRWLFATSAVSLLAFFALRFVNGYGEPDGWAERAALSATIVDFFDVTKYPPSLQFLLITLGIAAALLASLERAKGSWAEALATIGRVPFFYYVVHLYLIHALALGIGALQGFSLSDVAVIFPLLPPDFGVGLGAVYLWWIAVVLALYPACAWFARIKAVRREWWLRYL